MRNITRRIKLPWQAIERFEIGRDKLLRCVLLIRLTDGQVVAAFAVQGITGQPHRKTSIEARAIAEELNDRLARVKAMAQKPPTEGAYPSNDPGT